MEMLLEFMGRGLITMLTIAMPCVLTAAAIGLVVGILQAVTQVQEQTIAAAPKILGVFLVIMILGLNDVKLLTNLLQEGAYMAFNIIPKSDNYVLTSDYYKYTRPFDAEFKNNRFDNVPDVNQMMKNPGKVPFVDTNERLKYNAAGKMPNPRPNFIEAKKINAR